MVLSAVLIGLAASTCGATALCLGTFAHFLQLFNLYKDYLKLLLKEGSSNDDDGSIKKRKDAALSTLHFQFSVSLLWSLLALCNAPSLLAWSRDVQWAVAAGAELSRLNPDPSLIVAVAMAAAMPVTWGDRAPRTNARYLDKLCLVLQLCCVLVVLYGSLTFYRLNYFAAAAFVSLALHQLLAPDMTQEELEERKKQAAPKPAAQPAESNAGLSL